MDTVNEIYPFKSYQQGIIDDIDNENLKNASNLLVNKLREFNPSDFKFLAQNPLVEDCLCFINVYMTPHKIYLSKSEYFKFRKRDGAIIEQHKYPNGFRCADKLSGTYQNLNQT